MTATRPGRWMSPGEDEGRKQWNNQPVRLLLTCRRGGYEPWLIQRDIKVDPGRPRIRTVG